MFPEVLWKAELLCDKLGYLTKKTAKQSDESTTWFLLADYNKSEKRDKLREEMINEKEWRLDNFENSNLIRWQR